MENYARQISKLKQEKEVLQNENHELKEMIKKIKKFISMSLEVD